MKMPLVSDKHKEDRRAQIVAAALAAFARRGFAETSMRDILAESGLSAGAVYSYFPSKDDLVLHLAKESVNRWRASFSVFLQKKEKRPGDRLKKLVEEMLRTLEDKDSVREIGCDLGIWIHAVHHPELQEACLEVFGVVAAGFDSLLAPAKPSRPVGWSLLAHFQGLGLQAALGAPIHHKNERLRLFALVDDALQSGGRA